MPEYTLRCASCGEVFDRFAWGDLEDEKRTCPKCGTGSAVTVLWSVTGPGEDSSNVGCGAG